MPTPGTRRPYQDADAVRSSLRDLRGLRSQLEALPTAASSGNLDLAIDAILRQTAGIIERLSAVIFICVGGALRDLRGLRAQLGALPAAASSGNLDLAHDAILRLTAGIIERLSAASGGAQEAAQDAEVGGTPAAERRDGVAGAASGAESEEEYVGGAEEEYAVELRKAEGAALGLTVDPTRGGADRVYVEKLVPGLVASWNAAHPDRDVRPGDCIVEVNGLRGCRQQLLDLRGYQSTVEKVLLGKVPIRGSYVHV